MVDALVPLEVRAARPETDKDSLQSALAALEFPDRPTPFRPSRTNYPGSRFGPKTRYDLPQRHKAYGNADEADTLLFKGSHLQPMTSFVASGATPRGDLTSRSDRPTGDLSARTAAGPTPKDRSAAGTRVLSDTARTMMHPLADRNLPDLPLVDEQNGVHGILMIGGKGCGKTSLAWSFLAGLTGAFPSRFNMEMEEKRRLMPTYGQTYELPERDVRFANGDIRQMKIILTDTPACGTNSREEQPLCASISPNSTQHFNAIPSWMRITLRGGNVMHYSVLVVVDSMAKPLWEDTARCRDLVRLLAVMRKSQYTIVLGVTKLQSLREHAQRETAYGSEHGGQVGKDPRSSYEAFASRYIDKVCAAIQAKAQENDWSFSQGPDSPAFPLPGQTIFDLPTWVSVGDFRKWQEKKGTAELPNFKYYTNQLNRCLSALSSRSHPE